MSVKEKLNIYFSGPVIHAHLRLFPEDRHPSFEKHQFTIEAALQYLGRLKEDGVVYLSDTNHALLPEWVEGGDDTNGSFEERIEYLSRRLEERVNLIERMGLNILTGVEVDIISPEGELSIKNETLAKLDLVIASLHWDPWINLKGRKAEGDFVLEKSRIIEAFKKVAKNTHVDILGHPNLLPRGIRDVFSPEDFQSVLEAMIVNDQAWEINLSTDLRSLFNKQLLDLVVHSGVKVVIGLDFHHFRYYNPTNYFDDDIDQSNWESSFEKNYYLHSLMFLKVMRAIRLMEEVGLDPDRIVNSSNERFFGWLEGRI